jgi:hypothetical protein
LLGIEPHAPHRLFHDVLLIRLVVDHEVAVESFFANAQHFNVVYLAPIKVFNFIELIVC